MGVLKGLRQRFVSPVLRRHADRLLPGRLVAGRPRLARLAEMARWWRDAGAGVPQTVDRFALFSLVADLVERPVGRYLEFGVSTGDSLRWWAARLNEPDTRLVGFDTFEGIPAAWGAQPAGSYTAGGTPPKVDDDRVTFEVGLFADTVPPFFATTELHHPLLVHLDADLYDSTVVVLTALLPHLRPGDVLMFDELLDVGTADHEFAAFRDVAGDLGYEVLGAVATGPQVAMRVTRAPGAPRESVRTD